MNRITKEPPSHQSKKVKGDPLLKLIWKLAGLATIALLLFVVWNQFTEYQKKEYQKRLAAGKPTPIINLGKKAPDGWEMYVIANYNFAMPVPRFLSKTEVSNQGGYEYFIRLDKTDFSRGDGIAIGVSTNRLDDETQRILESILKDVEVNINESTVNIENTNITRIDIEVSGEGLEPRSILFFEKDGKTISISTTPDQVTTILDLITFVRV
jgi:hypothetical protein